jgi:restriction system protein
MHSLAEARSTLADQFRLTKEEWAEVLPSGRQSRFDNRVGWARVYMENAGLLASPNRGQFQITPRGQEVLANPPNQIDVKFLERFPEFLEFRTRKTKPEDRTPASDAQEAESETPEEALEAAHEKITARLASDLLTQVKSGSPAFFERLVVDLLLKMGYGGSRSDAGQAVGQAGDEGIDGIISEDRLGLDMIYLQAKKWEGCVGRPEVQKFVGALHGKRAKKGVFITTGIFSSEAVAYVGHIEPKVVLIDGKRLASLMIDFEVGVATARTYAIKRIDSDYFDEG